MYTRAQIERKEGAYPSGKTTIIQREDEDCFETERAGPGWTLRPGWHIAGCMTRTGEIEWADLR